MGNEELIQLFSRPEWEGKAFYEITGRIRKNDSVQNEEVEKLLFQYLKESNNNNVKELCMRVLDVIQRQEDIDYFITQLLDGKTRRDRILAAQHLGALKNASAVPALEYAISADKGVFGEGRSIARRAIFALGEIGEPAVPSLMKIWENEKLRYTCEEYLISAMGQTKDKRFTPVLIEVLDGNKEMIRNNAAWALGEIGDDTSIPALRKHQEDPNAKVRENVLQAISKIERNKITGTASQPTTNQTAVVVPQIPGTEKTNELGTAGNDVKP